MGRGSKNGVKCCEESSSSSSNTEDTSYSGADYGISTCNFCINNHASEKYLIDISGIAGGPSVCTGGTGHTTNCSLLNGLYIVSLSSNCNWIFNFPNFKSCIGSINMSISAGQIDIWFGNFIFGTPAYCWRKTFSNPFNCLEFFQEEIPSIQGTCTTTLTQCDSTNAKCLLTRI